MIRIRVNRAEWSNEDIVGSEGDVICSVDDAFDKSRFQYKVKLDKEGLMYDYYYFTPDEVTILTGMN